ncbi:MAG: transposase [Notoacmeibacter sp.]|nr:transposase [Notoacmeibacter sp.]MCB9929054.1 transposase [Alphaproteobacteria bacterium]
MLEHLPPGVHLLADRAYDSDLNRSLVYAAGAVPNIPSKRNRAFRPPFSPFLYRARNAIERMFCRIATRYDKLASS